MEIQIKYLILFSLCLTMISCSTLNPSIMLRTPRNFQYDQFPENVDREYKIASNDEIHMMLYSNKGYMMIDQFSQATKGSQQNSGQAFTYSVEHDGYVNLPIVGRILVKGKTIRETEEYFEELYLEYYNEPFIRLEITNRRVIIFPGDGKNPQVLSLQYENTTLFEALAHVGGITGKGKAKKIKLIRGDLKNPKVYKIDLSTIDGVRQADLTLQANDVIYVEPAENLVEIVLSSLTPYLSLTSTVLLIYTLVSSKK